MPTAIALTDTIYSWPGGIEPVLSVSNFSVEKGASVFLLGASGCGKSTLLNLIAGLILPQYGSVCVLNTNIAAMGSRDRDRFRAENIGLIFQQFNLIPYLDVLSNIRLAARLAGTSYAECDRRLTPLMDSLLLERSLLRRRADELSVGQQQRVSIARAMINHPQLLIADEPTSALDEEARAEFIDLLLATQQRTSATILFVSHDRSLARFFDKIETMQTVNDLERQRKHKLEIETRPRYAD